jgi:uncharacterized protein
MTILIIHGIGGYAGIHWQQWLHDELINKGDSVIMPSLPDADHPDRTRWLNEITQSLQGVIMEELVIVGHSLGATTALDFIEQSSKKIKAFISVSGFAKDYGADLNSYFLRHKQIDFNNVKENLDKGIVIYSNNDPYVTQDALKDVAIRLGVDPVIIKDGKHLNTEAGYTEFPELLQMIEELK